MKAQEKFELFSCFFAPLLLFIPIFDFPERIGSGYLILVLSVIFLLQTLIRDIYLLSQQRRNSGQIELRARSVFCLETTLGILGVIVGSSLLLSYPSESIVLSREKWVVYVALTMLFCYWVRDYVISWKPFKIYKDPDHINIVVSFK